MPYSNRALTNTETHRHTAPGRSCAAAPWTEDELKGVRASTLKRLLRSPFSGSPGYTDLSWVTAFSSAAFLAAAGCLTTDRLTTDRLTTDRLTTDRLTTVRLTTDRRTEDRLTTVRLTTGRRTTDRHTTGRLTTVRLTLLGPAWDPVRLTHRRRRRHHRRRRHRRQRPERLHTQTGPSRRAARLRCMPAASRMMAAVVLW